MRNEMDSPKEKKNKKRSAFFAFFLTSSILILALLPLLSTTMAEEKYDQVIEIAFADFSSSSKKAEEKAGAKKKTQQKKSVEKKVKKIEKVKPKPQSKAKKPVIVEDKTPDPIPVNPEPVTEPIPETADTPTTEETSAATESASDVKGNSADDGKGKGDYGNGTDVGKKGNGKDGEDFTGKAIFARKVTYRPDIKKIVKTKGKIAVNLCVNREGRVVLVKWDKENSTIRDIDNVRKTLDATKKYKFERDYSVPEQQCGKLTFIIDKGA